MLRGPCGSEEELSPSSGGLLSGMANGYIRARMQDCGNWAGPGGVAGSKGLAGVGDLEMCLRLKEKASVGFLSR